MASVNVWADGFGLWHASVPIKPDSTPSSLWREARSAIVDAITEREHRTFETWKDARRRVSQTTRVPKRPEHVTNHGTIIFCEAEYMRLAEYRDKIRSIITR